MHRKQIYRHSPAGLMTCSFWASRSHGSGIRPQKAFADLTLLTSKSRSVSSELPETMRVPSGLKATLSTAPVCPLRTRNRTPGDSAWTCSGGAVVRLSVATSRSRRSASSRSFSSRLRCSARCSFSSRLRRSAASRCFSSLSRRRAAKRSFSSRSRRSASNRSFFSRSRFCAALFSKARSTADASRSESCGSYCD